MMAYPVVKVESDASTCMYTLVDLKSNITFPPGPSPVWKLDLTSERSLVKLR